MRRLVQFIRLISAFAVSFSNLFLCSVEIYNDTSACITHSLITFLFLLNYHNFNSPKCSHPWLKLLIWYSHCFFACVGFLMVLWFPPTAQRHAHTLPTLHCPTVWLVVHLWIIAVMDWDWLALVVPRPCAHIPVGNWLQLPCDHKKWNKKWYRLWIKAWC